MANQINQRDAVDTAQYGIQQKHVHMRALHFLQRCLSVCFADHYFDVGTGTEIANRIIYVSLIHINDC